MSEEQKPVGDEPKPAKKRRRADKGLSGRQKKLLKGLERGKTITQAAIEAGYSPDNPKGAGQSGWQALRTMRKGFMEAAEGLGITPKAFIEKHIVPGMEATTEQKWCFMGGVVKAAPEPDWGNRLKYKMLFARLMGALRDEVRANEGETNYNFTLNLVSASEKDIAAILTAGARASRTIDIGGARGMVQA